MNNAELRIHTIRYPQRAKLDADFLKIFSPFHTIQLVIGSCRVNPLNGYLSIPVWYQRAYSLMLVILNIFIYIYISGVYSSKFKSYPGVQDLMNILIPLHFSSYFVNIIHVRFCRGRDNVALYKKIQELDRIMKIDKNKTVNEMMFKRNVIAVFIVLLPFIALLPIAINVGVSATVITLGIASTQSPFILDVTQSITFIIHFSSRILIINSILMNYLNSKMRIMMMRSKVRGSRFMRELVEKNYEFASSETDVYLRKIFDCFTIYQELYKFQIFVFCCKIVGYSILAFQFTLLTIQNNIMELYDGILVVTLAIVDSSTLILVCVHCEIFFREIKKLKLLTITLMAAFNQGPLRNKAKRMFTMIEETTPRFYVYDMWEMDAGFLLSFTNVITGLIVTLLQFAFL
ncbi:uncharacterized protein LOC131841391 [Achroia grisella]|uniref:uncharacterized protein LOC131841391 n=1 Tax=Achroia grisella TaxID=688607 RepID=UPI0027D2071A|nr:uncharacterized protein LOC131841391 [Achroia grisella]